VRDVRINGVGFFGAKAAGNVYAVEHAEVILAAVRKAVVDRDTSAPSMCSATFPGLAGEGRFRGTDRRPRGRLSG
jgi:hypothetical protein